MGFYLSSYLHTSLPTQTFSLTTIYDIIKNWTQSKIIYKFSYFQSYFSTQTERCLFTVSPQSLSNQQCKYFARSSCITCASIFLQSIRLWSSWAGAATCWWLKDVTVLRHHEHRDEVYDCQCQELRLLRLLLVTTT